MIVFVTGATGVLGRPTLRRLVQSGHTVRALARSSQNLALLGELGAEPVEVDLFNRPQLEQALSGCDGILHLATKIPPIKETRRREAWAENDRLRSEGTRLLVDAALAAGVRTVVYPGVCFLYADHGEQWIDVTSEIDPPAILRSSVVAESEIDRFTQNGGRGIALRMGAFYGPAAPNTVKTIEAARRGVALLIGRPEAFWSQIWVEDAAEAVVAALLRAPAGTYNVVDDEPLRRGEIVELMARAVGRKRLLSLPEIAVRLTAGKEALFAARSQRVSNRRFKEATGWVPTVPDAREGWARITEEEAAQKLHEKRISVVE